MFTIPSGEEIRNMRKRANLTQKELAKRTGVSQGLIAKIENNSVDPKISTVRKILKVLEEEIEKKEKEGYKGGIRACDIMTRKVISINHNETVGRALELMTAYAISQLPVMKNKKPIGAIDEESLLQALPRFLKEPEKFYSMKVEDLITTYFPVVDEETPLEELIDIFSKGEKGILVSSGEEIVGIITKIDVLNALSKRREERK